MVEIDVTTSDKTEILLTNIWYEVVDDRGKGQQPLIYLRGRTQSGRNVPLTVTGFRPYFLIRESEFENRRSDIKAVMGQSKPMILDYEYGHSGIDKDTNEIVDLVKLVCEKPEDITGGWNSNGLRDDFEKTWEADIDFTKRFLLDKDITNVLRVPKESECSHTEIEGVDKDLSIHPRTITFDIEVTTTEGGLPDYEDPSEMITAITLHDNYEDRYWTGVLEYPAWNVADYEKVQNAYENYENGFVDSQSESRTTRGDEGDTEQFEEADVDNDSLDNIDVCEWSVDGSIEVYSDEDQLLYDAIKWMRERNVNVLTGHNSDLFDIPYLVNRCLRKNVSSVKKLSPTEDVWEISNAPSGTNRSMKGITCWDAMTAFDKMAIHELKSKALESVAQNILGFGKDPIEDIDDAWKYNPEQFVKYNIRDVEAVVGYLREEELLDSYLNLQSITGTPIEDCHFNRNVIDTSFLQRALDYE